LSTHNLLCQRNLQLSANCNVPPALLLNDDADDVGWSCCFDRQPVRLVGPATVLRHQRGNCFELSTLLASLLLAAGYDAYVVSGYAGQTTCCADLSFDDCPLLHTTPPATPPPTTSPCPAKYRARPAKDLRSRYEQRMAAREQAELQRIHDLTLAEEMAKRAASDIFPSSSSSSSALFHHFNDDEAVVSICFCPTPEPLLVVQSTSLLPYLHLHCPSISSVVFLGFFSH